MKLPRRPVDYETRWSTVSYCVKFHIAFFEAAFTGAIFTHLVGDGTQVCNMGLISSFSNLQVPKQPWRAERLANYGCWAWLLRAPTLVE